MIKVGIFGAGHLGKIHIQQWLTLPGVELLGFFDPSDEQAEKAISLYGIKRYSCPDKLIEDCDALDIVTTTTEHFSIAKKCIHSLKHVFIEKPMTSTLEEARTLVKLAEEAKIKCQIGHVERYNPAFLALQEHSTKPLFIESHRLSKFNPRGNDVSVILDLMIHDIDIILNLVKSPVKKISASGVPVINPTADIANARLEFDNGCVANLTSSRISLKNMRKTRIFQKDAYISVDFFEKKTQIVQIDNESHANSVNIPMTIQNKEKVIVINDLKIKETNAIQQELADFTYSIIKDQPTKVSAEEGLRAMSVAYQILEKINSSSADIV